jgi:large subunit ribosomal protein L29
VNATELRELGPDELAAKLAEAKEELFNLRFQNVTGQLDNGNRLREVRHDIARVLTVMRQRELAGEDVVETTSTGTTRTRRGLGRSRRKG